MAVIDPGPIDEAHLAAITAAVEGADSVAVLLTHGHRDHAAAAGTLAGALGTQVWGPDGLPQVSRVLSPGDAFETDEGELIAVDTPGHAKPHLAFHWPARRAAFPADMLLGRGSTTWVGEYSGSVADYLRSLDALEALGVDVMYPAHGATISDPAEAIARYRAHRHQRIRQVEEALAADPDATLEDLLAVVYGAVPDAALEAARRSVQALRDHVGYSAA